MLLHSLGLELLQQSHTQCLCNETDMEQIIMTVVLGLWFKHSIIGTVHSMYGPVSKTATRQHKQVPGTGAVAAQHEQNFNSTHCKL
jgi:hypothetical protein